MKHHLENSSVCLNFEAAQHGSTRFVLSQAKNEEKAFV